MCLEVFLTETTRELWANFGRNTAPFPWTAKYAHHKWTEQKRELHRSGLKNSGKPR